MYHRYVEVDHLEIIQEKTLKYIKSLGWYNINMNCLVNWDEFIQICPEIMYAFVRYNIVPKSRLALISYHNIKIHIDGGLEWLKLPTARINLPILNCEGSQTGFYHVPEDEWAYVEKNGAQGHYQLKSQLNTNGEEVLPNTIYKVDEVEVIHPTVLAIRQPHSVTINKKNVPRIALSVGFTTDIMYLLDDNQII